MTAFKVNIGKQDRPMTTHAARKTRLTFTTLNLRIGLLRFVALLNGLILVTLLWALIVPDAPLGILAPLFADIEAAHPMASVLAIRAVIILSIGFVFFSDVSQSLRRLPPSYGSLTSLSGQAVLTAITLVYVLRGRLPPLALYGPGASLVLSGVGIIVVVQSFDAHSRYPVRALLYPILSVIMAGLGLSLIVSPDTATRQIIELRYGVIVLVTLLGLLAWGCGQLRQNHLTPDKMVKRLTGLIVFPVFSLRLMATGNPVSFLGLLLTSAVAALAVFLTFVQAEIERVHAERHVTPSSETPHA